MEAVARVSDMKAVSQRTCARICQSCTDRILCTIASRIAQGVQEEFKALVAAHNSEFNKSGVPYKANKRVSAGGDDETGEEQVAQNVPTSEVLTLDALKEKANFQVISATGIFELLWTETSELWVHGVSDGVISAKDALFPLVGKFLTGQAAIALKAEGAPPCFPPAGLAK